jgi:hypothetical protein
LREQVRLLHEPSMSPPGYERTPWRVGQHVCFTPRSRHPNADVGFSKKNVGFSLNSRRDQGIGFLSAPDPRATFTALAGLVQISTRAWVDEALSFHPNLI